jgi:hypothetical protein
MINVMKHCNTVVAQSKLNVAWNKLSTLKNQNKH